MFRKPFKVKSNSQVKGSERKTIKDNIMRSFPSMSEVDMDNLLPKKEMLNCIKIVTFAEETLQVYTVQKRPIVFVLRGRFIPTIFLLWKYSELIPSFTTHPQVLSNITSGADLMLPGVVPPANAGPSRYGSLNQNDLAYVNLSSNRAAIAVGMAAQSSFDMNSSNGRGKCLTICHSIGDYLCTLDGLPNIPAVNLGPPFMLTLRSYDEDFPDLGGNPVKIVQANTVEDDSYSDKVEVNEDITQPDDVEQEVISSEAMDDLLNYCFFTAIKYSKTLTLPILTSNFYKLQMMPVCPSGKLLDIKKSSHKKLKPFLDSLCKDGIIVVKEIKKGVESITDINKDHPRYCEFYIEPNERPKKPDDGPNQSSATSVTESYIITPVVVPLFAQTGLSKGDNVQMSEIRKHVTDYVKRHDCQVVDNKRLITPKEAIIKICKTENNITWEELFEKVCESMKSCFKVSSGAQEVVNKGKVAPIILSISKRAGNKKVTLVDNLDLYGIHIPEFAKECQHGVAASTTVSRPPGKKSDQLLVQGNQIIFINRLLTEKYLVPSKYIRGLEHAPKKK